MSKNKKTAIFYGIIFIFWLIILNLTPISGDDWGNFIEGSLGVKHWISQAVDMYFSWEGRIVSRLLINALTINKWLWNIVNSVMITGGIFLGVKIIKPKNIILSSSLIFLSFLLINIYTFSQVVVWIAGNITYLFPLVLILLYLYLYLSKIKFNKWIYTLLVILNIFIPMFVEHMGVILVLINIYFIVYRYHKDRKIDKFLLISLIISIISVGVMLLSPGTHLRSLGENTSFNELSIFGKVIYNIPNFIYYTYIVNYFMILLMVISFIILIIKNYKKIYLRIVLIIVSSLIPILSIISYCLSMININFISLLIDSNSIYIIIYYIVDTLLLIYLVYREHDIIPLLLLILGLCCNGVMLISPTWGFRTSVATVILISISLIYIIDKNINSNKLISYIVLIFSLFSIGSYLVLYINVNRLEKILESNIKDAIDNNSSIVEIPLFPSYVNCNINPTNDYHLDKFKKYYHIEDKEINFYKTEWEFLILLK